MTDWQFIALWFTLLGIFMAQRVAKDEWPSMLVITVLSVALAAKAVW